MSLGTRKKTKIPFTIFFALFLIWTQAIPALLPAEVLSLDGLSFATYALSENPKAALPGTSAPLPKPKLQSKSAMVIDGKTGAVLYAKDPNTKREPASITKIVTCMLALRHLPLGKTVTVKGKVDKVGNNINLKQGEKIAVKDLLYALMVYSANDSAVALAREIGGSLKHFSKMMNQEAKNCGAVNTNFLNPNGLNWQGQEAHLTTAKDLAFITQEAMKNPTFQQLVRTQTYTIPPTNKSAARKLKSTNYCLIPTKKTAKINGQRRPLQYPGTIGVKTGLTSTAGACFVGAVEHNGAQLISVVLHAKSKSRFSDSIQLWEYCLNKYYQTRTVVQQNRAVKSVSVQGGARFKVQGIAATDVPYTFLKGQPAGEITTKLSAKTVTAPIAKGQAIGTLQVYGDGRLIGQTTVLAKQAVPKGVAFLQLPILIAIVITLFLILLVCRCLRKRRPKNSKSEKSSPAPQSQPPLANPLRHKEREPLTDPPPIALQHIAQRDARHTLATPKPTASSSATPAEEAPAAIAPKKPLVSQTPTQEAHTPRTHKPPKKHPTRSEKFKAQQEHTTPLSRRRASHRTAHHLKPDGDQSTGQSSTPKRSAHLKPDGDQSTLQSGAPKRSAHHLKSDGDQSTRHPSVSKHPTHHLKPDGDQSTGQSGAPKRSVQHLKPDNDQSTQQPNASKPTAAQTPKKEDSDPNV